MFLTPTVILLALCILTICYVYVGYPLLLWVFTRGSRSSDPRQLDEFPSVSLIITAHNEIAIIKKKLENTLALTYPRNAIEILVASDGSDDGTDEVVKQFGEQGIRLHRLHERSGKLPALMSAVAVSTGDILLFSDANAMYEPEAVQRLITLFQDPQVGCVCGRLMYVNPSDTSISQGERIYWNYENQLKEWESRFNSLIGANGSIYAIRRAAYTPLDPDLSDDFGFPLAVYGKGYRVVYQPAAVSREEAPVSILSEFRKKSRFVAHQLTTLSRLWPQLRPLRDLRFFFQIVSHKLLRNMVPFFLIAIFILSFSLPQPLSTYMVQGQVVFYALAAVGLGLYRFGINLKLFTIPLYFCTVNAAAAVGIIQFMIRRNYAAWDD